MALSNLPAKVIAKAFRAGFHLTTQRAFPWPVGSSDRVVRYTPLDTEQLRVGGAGSLSTTQQTPATPVVTPLGNLK